MYERVKSYIVNLDPIPWKRAGIHDRHFFDRQQQEKLAFGLYLQQQHKNEPPFDNLCSFDITFFIAIPKSKAKRSSIYWAGNKGDLDNYVKFVLDTCVQSDIISDDHLICSIIAKKIYDKKPRTEFTIKELNI